MTMTSDKEAFAACLQEIESGSQALDAGDAAGTRRIALGLRRIFHGEDGGASLLSKLSGTYSKLASSVGKSPFPSGTYSPLADIVLDLGRVEQHLVSTSGNAGGTEPPRFQARLGRADKFRHVQAADWWKQEPAFHVEHSKVTRRDVILWASGEANAPSPLEPLLLKAKLNGLRGARDGGFQLVVPVNAATSAIVRQAAHEVLNSPDFKKLGR